MNSTYFIFIFKVKPTNEHENLKDSKWDKFSILDREPNLNKRLTSDMPYQKRRHESYQPLFQYLS